MNLKFNYYSNVSEEGKLQKNVSEKIADELKHFKGKRVEIEIKKLRSTRSSRQNRLWWLYMTIIGNELGSNKDEMHEIFKDMFLSYFRYSAKIIESGQFRIFSKEDENIYVEVESGLIFTPEQLAFIKKRKVTGSTTALSKSEFADMVTDLIRYCAEEFSIVLPLPDEQLEIF